jgi:hypothetical protein
LRAFLILAGCLAASGVHAACFTPTEVEAADLRVLQQQFNVAALNCQASDPVATFASRYNLFIKLFSVQLQNNSEVLYHHFGKDTKALDHWMTQIANTAGQDVYRNPQFCQIAWDRLEVLDRMSSDQMEAFVYGLGVAGDMAPACAPKQKKTPAK